MSFSFGSIFYCALLESVLGSIWDKRLWEELWKEERYMLVQGFWGLSPGSNFGPVVKQNKLNVIVVGECHSASCWERNLCYGPTPKTFKNSVPISGPKIQCMSLWRIWNNQTVTVWIYGFLLGFCFLGLVGVYVCLLTKLDLVV